MQEIKVTRNYVEALFDSAKKRYKEEEVFQDIKNIIEIVSINSELKNILYSPVVSKSNKIKLIKELTAKLGTEETLLKFLIVLVKNAREYVLNHLADHYKQILDASKGIKQVEIKSSKILDDKDKAIIDEYLETELTKNNFEVKFEVDSSLLGGILIQYDNKIIDLSIAGFMRKIDDVTRSTVVK